MAGVADAGRRQVLGRRTFWVDLEERNLGLNKAIREAKSAGYNVIVVIGQSEASDGKVGWDIWENGKYVKRETIKVQELYDRLVDMEREYQ